MVAEKVPASRGATVPALLGFMGGVFGYDVQDALRSARIRGLSVRIKERKGALATVRAPDAEDAGGT